MRTYDLRILYYTGKSSYLPRRIHAAGYTTASGYYNFYDEANNLVFTSPLNLTIIDKVS